jgi:hypothetical protein
MSASKGFFNMLFEFSFSRFIGIRVLGVLYAIGIFFSGLLALGVLMAGFSRGFWSGLGALIVTPLLFLLYVIFIRIALEGFAAALRTAENTTQLLEHAKRNS